ncbi:AAA family ATPase [Streptomyces sp. NPDC057236]|uniref:AAA family ATPase n=1 Tax=Streptomyces sp. NPDC057236 TaxID=3346059 RepID=UPI00363FC3CE
MDPALFAKFTAPRADALVGRGEIRRGDTAVALPDDVQAVLDALERKGQVILHGPPGTGKTRLALGAALALTDRADALGAEPRERAEAQVGLLRDDRVRLVTFHPSYGHEDFVEGFKPDLDATGPGLTLALALKDGLFHDLCRRASDRPAQSFLLVIDEINRGDLPRVLGELITLLELDKRDLSATTATASAPRTSTNCSPTEPATAPAPPRAPSSCIRSPAAAPIVCWRSTALRACSPRCTSSASTPTRTLSRRLRGSGTRPSEPTAAGGRILAVLHHPLIQHA